MSSDGESINSRDEVRSRNSNEEIDSDTPLETEVIEGETQQAEPQTEENKNDSEDESKKKVVKPKRVVKNPRPKFNEETLKSEKGLQAIKEHFKGLKLKGKGYEEYDLNAVLKSYEYWCHRFYPKYTFEDSIARLEVLGPKKATRTYLTRIRMGMESFVEEEKTIQSDDEIPTTGFVEPFNDQFDNLIATNVIEPEPELSEEVLERIRQNKLRAEALRKERLSRIGQSNGIIDQNTGINQSQSNNEQTETQMDESQEMDLDNMLDMINEEPGTSRKDEIISKSIRSARFKTLLYNDSDEENIEKSQNTSHPKKRNISLNDSMESDDNKESDHASGSESTDLNKNEKPGTSRGIDSQKTKDEVISESIRSARFKSLLSNDSDEENIEKSQNTSHPKKRNISLNDSMESDDSNKESDHASDSESSDLNKFNGQKKKRNLKKSKYQKLATSSSESDSDKES